jgi:hypothetical protein
MSPSIKDKRGDLREVAGPNLRPFQRRARGNLKDLENLLVDQAISTIDAGINDQWRNVHVDEGASLGDESRARLQS